MSIKDTGTEKMIKDTAKRVFFAEGKLHATTQDIANEAGISRTSLHYYYRSRNELLKQIFNEGALELRATMNSIMDSDFTFREKIEKMISCVITEQMAYPYRETFMLTEMLDKDVDLFKMKKDSSSRTKKFIKELESEMKAGNITPMDPIQFMMNMYSLTSYPLLMRPLHMALFNLSERKYRSLMNNRRKLIVEMLFRK